VVGAVQWKARPENAVLWNGTDSSGTVEERSAATDARCDETAEVDGCRCAAGLERQHG